MGIPVRTLGIVGPYVACPLWGRWGPRHLLCIVFCVGAIHSGSLAVDLYRKWSDMAVPAVATAKDIPLLSFWNAAGEEAPAAMLGAYAYSRRR